MKKQKDKVDTLKLDTEITPKSKVKTKDKKPKVKDKNKKEVKEDLHKEMSNSTNEKSDKYVVVRDGYRVSDRVYDSPTDPECVMEVQMWTKIAKNFSHGEKVKIEPSDAKKHRIW